MNIDLRHGDCLVMMRELQDASVDAVVTDPPYGLSFMGKRWDYDVPGEDVWRECLRVLKPGGHLLAFAGTRTQHRMAVRIEDAGFEIRDMIAWVYGSGFPKSLDVSKAIDKAAGAEREVVGEYLMPMDSTAPGRRPTQGLGYGTSLDNTTGRPITAPATDAARQWAGWGTALKPAMEPITVARKPMEGTVAENVQEHGTGAINVDGCRVECDWSTDPSRRGWQGGGTAFRYDQSNRPVTGTKTSPNSLGRWPANLIHDGSAEVVGLFPESTRWFNAPRKGDGKSKDGAVFGQHSGSGMNSGDSGSAARFFYCAKASKADRDDGCEGLPLRAGTAGQKRCAKCGRQAVNVSGTCQCDDPEWVAGADVVKARNYHPTVKPTALMRYLCRLVTPPGGIVLDPFMGSGSTGKACALEGFRFIGIEREAEYIEIAKRRIMACQTSSR